MKCPNCNSEIPSININVQTDVAQCSICSHVFKISENLTGIHSDSFDINSPPDGAWINKDMNSLVFGATTRSWIAFFLVPFMLIWSGGSLGGIYGTQIMSGHFNPFMSLFGIPFILGSILFWSFALMAIWGKVELTVDNDGGKIFTGLGKVGITRKFSWNEISSISESSSRAKYPGGSGSSINLEGKKRISFGTGLNESRRYYLFKSLQSLINQKKSGKFFLQGNVRQY